MTAFVGFPQDGHSFSGSEVGHALAGLIGRESSGLPRVGMLGGGPTVGAVPASWKVQVGRFVYVHQVAGAVQLSGLSADEQVDIVPAVGSIPAGQARIDVVCWNPAEAALVVVEGLPAVSPGIPNAGVLVPVARVRVNATDGMVIAGQVSAAFVRSALAASTDRQAGSVAHPAGGSVLSGAIYASPVRQVTYPTPFGAAPRVVVTATTAGAQVAQWGQVFGVTAIGFSYRVLAINKSPNAGQLNWEAESQ